MGKNDAKIKFSSDLLENLLVQFDGVEYKSDKSGITILHLKSKIWQFGAKIEKSHLIYLKYCTLINMKALVTHLTGFIFSQILLLILGNFERIN